MKKVTLFVLFVFVVSFAFATEGNMVFMWNQLDPAVNYFRYSVDGGEWITVHKSQRDSIFAYAKNEDHYFAIAQSYDGELWSDPMEVKFSSKPEYNQKEKKQYSHFASSIVFVPFETYLATSAHGNSREYRSVYAAGLELSAVGYIQERIGFGATVEGTFAYIGKPSKNTSLNFSAYGISAYRVVSHSKFELVAEVGFGAQFESVNGTMYVSPSVLLQADATLKVFEDLSVSISPSVSASFSDFDFESDYMAYNIRAIGVGIKYSL